MNKKLKVSKAVDLYFPDKSKDKILLCSDIEPILSFVGIKDDKIGMAMALLRRDCFFFFFYRFNGTKIALKRGLKKGLG